MDIENRSNIKEKVREILAKNIHCRDNHNATIYQYFLKYCRKDYPMFSDWFIHNVSVCNTIERHNRLLQEKHPELRGAKYKERKVKEIKVRNLARINSL